MYKSTSYNVSELTNDDLVATAARNMDSKYIAYCVSPEEELEESFSIETFNKSLNELVRDRTVTIDMIKNIKEEASLTAAQYQIGEIGFVINSDNREEKIKENKSIYGIQIIKTGSNMLPVYSPLSMYFC